MYDSIQNINQKYDGQWLFMVNCKENENGSIIGGDVILHNENIGYGSVHRLLLNC